MSQSNQNQAETSIAALVAAQTLARPVTVGNNGVPAAVVPMGYDVRQLEKFNAVPSRMRGQFNVVTADAFNRAVGLYRSKDCDALPIFFGRSGTSASVVAVLNSTTWRDFTVVLAQNLSQPFLDWYRLNNQPQLQRKFALFLEERTSHVVKPDGASLLELTRKFKANVSVRFSSIIEQENGDNALEFIQTTEAGTASAKGRMKVPNFITLGLPVWHGSDPVKIEARFGYSIGEDGKLSLSFEILRLEELLTEELRKIVEKIGKAHDRSVIIEGSNAAVPAL